MPERTRVLELALRALEVERAKIEGEIAEIRGQLHVTPTGSNRTRVVGAWQTHAKKRTMSPEARKRISEGMKRKHAERRRLAGKAA
jgi:hypothetical protein